MRRVWGWTPASSAATEITKTARSRRRPWACSGDRLSPPSTIPARPPHSSLDPEAGPGGLVRQGRELLQELLLLARQAGRDRDRDRHQQVAGRAAPAGRDPAPADPERLA